MSALGKLVVSLSLEYAEFTKGLDKNSQEALKFGKGIQQSFDTAANSAGDFFVGLTSGALATVGAFAGISATIDRLNSSIDMLAQLDDAAQKTGSSVESLSKIQQVAVEFSHDFGLIDTSISKLAKGMATFDSETNYTSRALKALGVESRDAAGKLRDPSQVMIEIAKNLQNFQDGAAKSALVTDLFGKSGAELLPILNDMADNVDRFAGVSAESAAQAALFQDQIGAMRTRIDDAAMSFTTGLLPSLLRITGSAHDAGDGMDFFSEAGRGVGSVIEWLLEKGSAAQMMFGNLGDVLGTRARQMIALVKGDFQAIGQLEKNLDNEIGKRLAEHQNYVAKITSGNREIAESAAEVKKSLNYQTGTQGAASTTASAYERAAKSATDYITRLREETEAIGFNAIQVKMLAAAHAAADAPLESQRIAIMASAQAWAEMTQAQEDNVTAAKLLESEEKKRLDGYQALVSGGEKTLESLKARNDLLQFGTGAVAAMGQADLQAALDRAWAADNIDPNVINMLERRLELSKQLAAEANRGESLEAARDAAKEASNAWQNTARDINRSLTDALLRGFESGKGFAQNLRDTIVHMFQTTVLRPVIDAVMSPMSKSISSVIGAVGLPGVANAAGGAAGAGATGAAGAAGGMASMAGPIGAVIAGWAMMGQLGSSLGAGKKIFGIKGDSILNFLPFAPGVIGILAGLFGKGPKQLGPAELTGDFAEDGFRGEFQADWTRKVGLFGGKKRGRRGLGISDDQVNLLNDTVFGITDSFKDFIKFTGDADRSLTDWTFAVRRQIETEEQQAQLTVDLANSIGAKLIPELTALQQKGESLIDTAARAQAEFALMTAMIDMTGQSFGKIGLASLGLRDNLVQLLGGLQGASATLQPFFDNFYSEAERVASTGRLMNAELERLGITTIPTTREQFRALVEVQDLSTTAGQEMFAALLRVGPAFASVTDAIGQAAAEAEAEAQRIADSIQLLTTDAFETLFDYTKYIRLAANAGVTAAQPAGPVFQAPAQVFPSFAVGTNSLPGDMTINAHAGERIVPAADNRELMRRLSEPNEGMRAMAEEIRKLREENKAQAIALIRAANSTAKTSDRMLRLSEEWDAGGMPQERST